MARKIPVSVCPWSNTAEFNKVYEYLFSDELIKKKWAVDAISVWENRCHPSLPTAIEATYVLTSAVIQDILWTNKSNLIYHTDLQGIYGSALTRFVCLTVEANKSQDCPLYSIAEIAKSIGIPSFIVDIRNEWSHSIRPSLSVLRLAAQSALNYLKESYWVKEATCVKNYANQFLDDSPLCEVFDDFIKFHQDTLKSIKVRIIKSDYGTITLDLEYSLLLKKLEEHLTANKRFFVEVLIYDGNFIPTDEEFKQAVSKAEYELFATESSLNDEDYEIDSSMEEEIQQLKRKAAFEEAIEFESKNFPEVPQYHEDLWHPVIALLNKYDAVPLFMEELLKSQGNRTIVGQKIIITWMLRLLRFHGEQPSKVSSHMLKGIFKNKGITANWLRMLHSALINPCKFTLILLPLLLNKVHLEKEEANRIVSLLSLKFDMVPIEGRKRDYWKLYHSADDLKKDLERHRNHKENKQQKKKGNIPAPCPDDCYKLWSFGHVVNAVSRIDDEEEEEECDFEDISEMKSSDDNRMLPSNKNENDDDDDACKMNKGPDLNKIMLEIEKRETVLYTRSG